MGRRRGPDRVLGPYGDPPHEPTRWRIVVIATGADGVQRREEPRFDMLAEAEEAADAARAALQRQAAITVAEAIDLFLAQLGEVRPATRETVEHQLRAYYAPVLDEPLQVLLRPAPRRPDQPPRAPTVTRGADLYRELRTRDCARPWRADQPRRPMAAATHRRYLREAHRAARWWVAQRLLAQDPLAGVTGVGKVHRGKVQLHLDEARQLTSVLFQRAAGEDPATARNAVAVLLLIFLALRSGELRSRRVRDVDDGGRRLVLLEGDPADPLKTRASAAGAREVPAQLVPLLRDLAAGRDPGEYLFGGATKHHAQWLLQAVHRACEATGVRTVCAHALRGLAASLVARSGGSAQLIADLLRHGDRGELALQAYVAPGAVGEGQRAGLAGLLLPAQDELITRLRALAERWRREGDARRADELLREIDG